MAKSVSQRDCRAAENTVPRSLEEVVMAEKAMRMRA